MGVARTKRPARPRLGLPAYHLGRWPLAAGRIVLMERRMRLGQLGAAPARARGPVAAAEDPTPVEPDLVDRRPLRHGGPGVRQAQEGPEDRWDRLCPGSPIARQRVCDQVNATDTQLPRTRLRLVLRMGAERNP
jgi:hypothetical protein